MAARPLTITRPERKILTDDVYETIKALIMDHAIEPGARVNIDWLARELDVSQTPIREALARLKADSLVVKQALRGYSTTPLLTRAELVELYTFRLLIEPWAARKAAEQVGPVERRRLRTELQSSPAAPDRDTYAAYKVLAGHDARFHDLVAELAGNEQVRAALEHTHCHLHVFRLYYGQQLGSQATAEHRRIARAISANDADAAEHAMRQHLERSFSRLQPAAEDRAPTKVGTDSL